LHNTDIKQVNHVEILSMIFLCSFKELFFFECIWVFKELVLFWPQCLELSFSLQV